MRLAIPARPERTNPPLQIQTINRALREAALAPTANDALDRCADALLHLAKLARVDGHTKSPCSGYLTFAAAGHDAEVRHD